MNQNTRDNNKSGYLYINKQKTAEKQPDWRGKVTINGVEYLISGWERMQNGDKMISLKVTDPKDLPAAGNRGTGGDTNRSTGSSGRGSSVPSANSAPSSAPSAKPYTPPAHDNIPDLDDLDNLFDGN